VGGLTERDEPVFQIQQGTAITIAIRGSRNSERQATVRYCDSFGSIAPNFARLNTDTVQTMHWIPLQPEAPYYFFTPKHVDREYSTYWSITDIFGTGNRQKDKEKRWAPGFASQQDGFAISFSDQEVNAKIRTLVSSVELAQARQHFRLCTTNQWNYDEAKKVLAKREYDIATCAYRPFDERKTVFSRHVVSILRTNVMAQFDRPNLGLVLSRVINDGAFSHVFVTTRRTDKIFLSSSTSTNAYIFPLYLYPGDLMSQADIFDQELKRAPNLSQRCIQELEKITGLGFIETGQGDGLDTFGPEAVFYYVYAVLHSPLYRKNNDDELRMDFPRIPMPLGRDQFGSLWELGRQLVQIHLLRRNADHRATFPVKGSNTISMAVYRECENGGRVYINNEQFFQGIASGIWIFRVGGYAPLQKWLLNRRGQTLSFDDINHYRSIIWALEESLDVMDQVDIHFAPEAQAVDG
jgi:hypothetical protein